MVGHGSHDVLPTGTVPFAESWGALGAAVSLVPDDDFARPSGCAGWLIQDLVSHLIIGAQDVLITLATPSDDPATHDAATYWDISSRGSTGDDPLDALTVRLAAAYEDPSLLKHHFDDVGSAARRAAELADPASRVATQCQVLTAGDYLGAYVLEATLHHLDLIANLDDGEGPPASGLAWSRALLERISGVSFPQTFSDEEVLVVATGRRVATDREKAYLDALEADLPVILR
jgi:uncharacterized protein (TIGR03083 family)